VPKSDPIIITFGGGLNTRKRTTDIDINECVAGANFDLQDQYLALKGRKPFDLVATATNAESIRGFAQLTKQDGSISTLIQAGDTMYEWDHDASFTDRGAVSANSRMRGPKEHNFTLDEFVIITDLDEQTPVKKWDGTTFSTLAHNLGGDFFARYCRVHLERATYGNVKSGTATPHLIVGSKRGDSENLSVSDRPAGTLGLDDPFFIPTPDLRPVNGLEQGFGTFIISTQRGKLYALVGESSFDFKIEDFYDGSSVSGDEAMTNIGNDIALGLPARIETLSGTIKFGDVQADDLTNPVAKSVENVTEWTLAYNKKTRRLYCFPDNQSACWVLYKPLIDTNTPLSPWSRWTTGHTMDFQPTTVMPLVHPSTKEDLVYLGDGSGNIYLLEGTGSGDGGTTAVNVSRTTGLIRGIPEGSVFDVEGWITYRRNEAATVTLTLEYSGEAVFDKSIVINIPASTNQVVYNGSGVRAGYYNGSAHYGTLFSDRISRQKWTGSGLEDHFQLRIDVESQAETDIQEIGFTINTA
jgi:hypothetical protein